MRKLVNLAALLFLSIGLVVVLEGFTVLNYEFKDVEEDKWYTPGIEYVVKEGLMQGVARYYFYPNSTVTRAQMAQILYNLDNTKVEVREETPLSIYFSDVKSDGWYTKAIDYAFKEGYMSGYGDSKFGPDDYITRGQIACTLYNYLGVEYNGDYSELDKFKDGNKTPSWARNALAYMVQNEIINGDGDKVRPNDRATRAEIATILKSFCEKILNVTFDKVDLKIEKGLGYVDVTFNGGDEVYGAMIAYTGTDSWGTDDYQILNGQTVRLHLSNGVGYSRVTVYGVDENGRSIPDVWYQEHFDVTEEDVEVAKTISSSRFDYENQPELRKIVDSIWDENADTMTNVRACYDWVANNIEYSDIRVDEREPGYLTDFTMMLEKREGICGDYACFLAAMLRYKGIESYELISISHAYTLSIVDGREVYMDSCWSWGPGYDPWFDYNPEKKTDKPHISIWKI